MHGHTGQHLPGSAGKSREGNNCTPDLLARAEKATTVLTDVGLTAAAGTPEEAERWIQPTSNLKYSLINTTTAAEATVRRQNQAAMGLEVHRQLCQRLSTPGKKEHWLPHKVAPANLQPQQL